MSDRLKDRAAAWLVENESADAKVLTTADAKALPEHGDEDGGMPGVVLVDRDDLLATTRALEKLEEGLKLWHGTPPDERAMLAIENAGELWRGAVARAEKAERERDEARATVADLVDASERLLEHYSDGIPDHLVDEFRAALEKAKGETR